MKSKSIIDVFRPCWLIASGDEKRLAVLRSPLVRERDRMYREVRDHIAEHGLVLSARGRRPDPEYMFGEVEMSIYGAEVAA
ncbi:hypothetical protein LK459_17595 [Gordonia otitidis]|uniref:hypothetical protein n=1 Tax=Gordonia otitidis TaxID=249058 RepID=UPI001D147D8C|nr:hypothetical protein [Gordonia otitidis]UEA58377.1 hypothetical protein LK459_17595 [Gordonia otitidis]